MTKRSRTYAIKPKRPPSAAYFIREIRLLGLRVIELERRLKRTKGEAAFRAYQDAVAKQVEQDADTFNVVMLRR